MKISNFKFQIKQLILSAIFISGLIYVLIPGPRSISKFSPIPDSLKSDEPGDTTQIPHVAAYFSNYQRSDITNFFHQELRKNYLFGNLLPPVSLSYPPRAASQYVRDLQVSTFLEEYVYPLREPFFVNGYEPYVENEIKKLEHTKYGDLIHINGQFFKSKTTLRLYPTQWYVRLIVYLGIWVFTILIYKLGKRVIFEKT